MCLRTLSIPSTWRLLTNAESALVDGGGWRAGVSLGSFFGISEFMVDNVFFLAVARSEGRI